MHADPAVTPEARQGLDELIDSYVSAHVPHGEGTVSVWFGSILGRPSYAREEHEPHYAASTMKLPLLLAGYRQHERGELDLDAMVPVHNAFRSAADGSGYSLQQSDDQDDETWNLIGSSASLRRLAHHSVVKSGNLATNLVLEHVGQGQGEVASVLVEAGCSGETLLPRGIEDVVAREDGLDNIVTARDLALVMGGIASRSLASERTCAEVEQVVSEQEHRDKIPAGLPEGTYVANKTGWVTGVAHDVALVRPEAAAPFVLVVCTSLDLPDEKASELIADVSRRIWEGRQA